MHNEHDTQRDIFNSDLLRIRPQREKAILYIYSFVVTATSFASPARPLDYLYQQENGSIYYEPVPDFDMLDPLPEPIVIMKPLLSEQAPPPTETLSFKATGSSEVGNGKGGVDAAEGGDKTDEEIARALHEKLNT